MKNIFQMIALMMIITSCIQLEKADLILYNGKIYTVDKAFSIAEAVAIRDGKIIDVGAEKDILAKYDAAVKTDLQGKPVYPGFIDAHCHFYGYGVGLAQKADLRGTRSFEEVVERVKKHAQSFPSVWIQGRGWDQNDWEIKEFPDKTELDRLFPENPVILSRVDGHAVLVNSKALELAGITADTKYAGGHIEVKNGEPTGILLDNAIDSVRVFMPENDLAVKVNGLLKAQENCFAVGLTGVCDAGLDYDVIDLIDSIQKAGDLKMRINAMLSPDEENFEHYLYNGIYETERLKVNSVKLYADGALGSRGACLLEPYSDDPHNHGLIIDDVDFYRDICGKAIKYGYQVNTHAIGDSGNRMMLDIYGEFLEGKNDQRWRVEHAQLVDPDDFQKFKEFNIIPSIQATHATSDMYWAGERVGPERIRNAYAYKKLLEQNGWLPNGTDFPVEKIDPLLTFYATVARKDLDGYPEGGFQLENGLSREETLKSMTIWAAKGGFEEERKGSIEVGKFGDFVVLDGDIMEVDMDQIPDVKVLRTIVGGEEVYLR